MIMIIKFIFNISNFSIIVCFLTKLLTLGILFYIAVNAVFVAKLLISEILFSNSVLSVLYLVFNTKSLVSILSTFATKLLYTVYLTTSFYCIT